MVRIQNHRPGRRLAALLTSLAAVFAITYLCFPGHQMVTPAMLYLLTVVLESLWGNFVSATIVSIVAAAALDFFFIDPILTFRINNPQDSIALLTYVVISLVITRLASTARAEAAVAERKRKDTRLLYEVSSRLLALPPDEAAGPRSVQMIRQVFDLRDVCFFDASFPKSYRDAEPASELAARTREAYMTNEDLDDEDREIHVRRLHAEGKLTGAAGFQGRFDDDSMLSALTALAGTALERMRSSRSSARAAAGAQAEMLRSAILDAFAHEFKTPLAIIMAAAGGLRETTAAPGEQLEMADIIENQTLRLTELTTRLLRLSRLDREEVAPDMQRIDIHELLLRLVRQYEAQSGRRFAVNAHSPETWITVDPELAGLAISQLLDNACKYSPGGTVIGVDLNSRAEMVDICISNMSCPISGADRERIFERFARGLDAQHTTGGAGLGLHVARKIANAHGGFLHLEDNGSSDGRITFRISFPVSQDERKQHEQACESVGSGR